MTKKLDAIDLAILAALQENADASIAEVAAQAGVSQTPCWKRIKKMQAAGVIEKKVALVDPAAVGLKLVGYVHIRTAHHTEAWARKFSEAVKRIPEVVECHRMTGDIDYLMKIVSPDMEGYDEIYKRLIRIVDLSDVSVSFSMERLKSTTELPLDYASRD
ncbi:MAG: Lrp/AsnC family transcriptional regulator [Parvularculaceae bacterium]